MSGYRKNFEETEYMYFLIKDEELLIKYMIKSVKKSAIPLKKDLTANQRFSVRVCLLAMCRGELSAVIAWLMSKCL